ncbi:MAG: reverse transcriptase domain-containing protein [Flavobacteriales bacterium]
MNCTLSSTSCALANLYLHYAFDRWMQLNYPQVKFERYADDIIVHTMSKEESEKLLQAIKERLNT